MLHALKLIREWKHLTLLVGLLAFVLTQPAARSGFVGVIALEALLTAVMAVIFFVVFERRSTRLAALVLLGPMICAHWIGRGSGPYTAVAFMADHYIAPLFLGFAVTAILRGIFQPKKFRADDLFGVVCGYLLAGLAWGGLYNLTEIVSPHSFSVRSDIEWQMDTEAVRRYVFDSFSFATLTCMGDTKVVPVGQTASSLAALEAIFGQFYMALVVAQLVGLKLSQAVAKPGDGET